MISEPSFKKNKNETKYIVLIVVSSFSNTPIIDFYTFNVEAKPVIDRTTDTSYVLSRQLYGVYF